jgi:hypothetical protein
MAPTLAPRADTTQRRPARQNTPVSLQRVAWLLTVVVCLIIAGVLLLEHYRGYPAVALALAIAAAINLF